MELRDKRTVSVPSNLPSPLSPPLQGHFPQTAPRCSSSQLDRKMPSTEGGLGQALVGDKIMVNTKHVQVHKLLGEGAWMPTGTRTNNY